MVEDPTPAVRPVAGGVELVVFCQPKAARTALVGMHGGALKAKVKAPPLEGRANDALLRLLAEALGVAPGALALESGEHSRNKRVRVAGVGQAAAVAALRDAMAPLSGGSGREK